MQTAQFQCGSCKKLMAVGVEHLGRQVRCPHCQAVVVAPAASPSAGAPPAPPAPASVFGSAPGVPGAPAVAQGHEPAAAADPASFPVFQPNPELESIFAPPEVPDALFGGPEPPRLELPPAPQSPTPPSPARFSAAPPDVSGATSAQPWELLSAAAAESQPPPGPMFAAPSPGFPPDSLSPAAAPAPPPGDGAAFLSPTMPPDANGPVAPAADEAAAWMAPAAPGSAAETEPGADPASDFAAGATVGTARKARRQNTPWFTLLVFVPLVSYAVLATVAVIILWNRLQERPADPREYLPDVGDSPGPLKPRVMAFPKDNFLTEAELPRYLCTRLGEPITLGDLQVTPLRVERRTVAVVTQGRGQSEPLDRPSLVLHLRLRNLARDYAFAPLDNYFDRYDTGEQPRPLTQLEAGRERFYGGPAHWYARNRSKRENTLREWVAGRKDFDDVGLQPGEVMESFVCTDGTERIARYLGNYHGPLRWRVHLRRGLVAYKGERRSATALIGVEFTDREISTPGEAVPAANS